MSSRSRDLISATLISAGIICAGEVHLAVTTGNSGFRDYWTDWFDNDRWHENISTGEAQMTAGRNDVLLVSPGSFDVTGTLTWNLHNTHLVGAGAIQRGRPQARLQLAGTGAVTPMVTVAATGVCFSNLTMRHGRDANANAGCHTCLQISSGAGDFVGRNLFIWGPEDDTLNDSTGYKLVRIHDHTEWYNCLFGYGWSYPATPTLEASLMWFKKSSWNSSTFDHCTWVFETSGGTFSPFFFEYAQSGGVYYQFKNCLVMNVSSGDFGSCFIGDGGGAIWAPSSAGKISVDSNTMLVGFTDVAPAAAEGRIFFSPSQLASTGTGDRALKMGLAQSFDHTE